MPILLQQWITREDLRANPDKLFVFGDNVARKGYGGQAKEMRGEPNAIGIPTKWAPSMQASAMFYDHQMADIIPRVIPNLEMVREALIAGKTVVWPADGIGSGRAKLRENAPTLVKFLETWMNENIQFT